MFRFEDLDIWKKAIEIAGKLPDADLLADLDMLCRMLTSFGRALYS